jgi:hypothetical protein
LLAASLNEQLNKQLSGLALPSAVNMLPRDREESSPQNPSNSQSELVIATERRLEKLVSEISALVHSAEPAKRESLRELAETLLHQEMLDVGEATESSGEAPLRSRSNPLAAGLLLLAAGAGLVFIVPPIGLTLMVLALALIGWGAVISFFRK